MTVPFGMWDRAIDQVNMSSFVKSVVWSLMVSGTLRGRFGLAFRRDVLKEINQ